MLVKVLNGSYILSSVIYKKNIQKRNESQVKIYQQHVKHKKILRHKFFL